MHGLRVDPCRATPVPTMPRIVPRGTATNGTGRHRRHGSRSPDFLWHTVDRRGTGAPAGGAGAGAAPSPDWSLAACPAAADLDRDPAVPPDRRGFHPAHPDPAHRGAVCRQPVRPAPGAQDNSVDRGLAGVRCPAVWPLETRLARPACSEPAPDRHGRAAARVLRHQGRAGTDSAPPDMTRPHAQRFRVTTRPYLQRIRLRHDCPATRRRPRSAKETSYRWLNVSTCRGTSLPMPSATACC